MKSIETVNEGLKRGFMLTIPAQDIEARVEQEVKHLGRQKHRRGNSEFGQKRGRNFTVAAVAIVQRHCDSIGGQCSPGMKRREFPQRQQRSIGRKPLQLLAETPRRDRPTPRVETFGRNAMID